MGCDIWYAREIEMNDSAPRQSPRAHICDGCSAKAGGQFEQRDQNVAGAHQSKIPLRSFLEWSGAQGDRDGDENRSQEQPLATQPRSAFEMPGRIEASRLSETIDPPDENGLDGLRIGRDHRRARRGRRMDVHAAERSRPPFDTIWSK
jgi:ATP/maltotriose-dependent transcriptional regulator MalT